MDLYELPEGATPLDPNAMSGLVPRGIVLRSDLDEFEQRNIVSALLWARRSRAIQANLLSDHGLRLLHRRMFDQTWRWARRYRESDTNIGCPWYQIATQVINLCADIHVQIEHESCLWDELSVRFHHRLVSIHPFPNGNGRHARLATDLLLRRHHQPSFTWGAVAFQNGDLSSAGELRTEYIASLREADRGRITRPLDFAKS